jgi:hypothetical protein
MLGFATPHLESEMWGTRRLFVLDMLVNRLATGLRVIVQMKRTA